MSKVTDLIDAGLREEDCVRFKYNFKMACTAMLDDYVNWLNLRGEEPDASKFINNYPDRYVWKSVYAKEARSVYHTVHASSSVAVANEMLRTRFFHVLNGMIGTSNKLTEMYVNDLFSMSRYQT